MENNEDRVVQPEENPGDERMNPWFSIYLRPRETMRYIINNKIPFYWICIITGIIAFVQQLLIPEPDMTAVISLPWLMFITLLVLPLISYVGIFIYAALIKWVGKLLKGQGTSEEIRAAVAWGSVPPLFIGFILSTPLLLFPHILLNLLFSPRVWLLMYSFFIIAFCLLIWYVTIQCRCLGEVQGFSAWKAFVNVLLAVLLAFLIYSAFIILLYIIGLG